MNDEPPIRAHESSFVLTPRGLCSGIAIVVSLTGGIGMVTSFSYLASVHMADITAGASGLIGGSILVASGLLSLTMVVTRPHVEPNRNARQSESAARDVA